MISPHTPPGTKVEIVKLPRGRVDASLRVFGFVLLRRSKVIELPDLVHQKFTLAHIKSRSELPTGFGASLAGIDGVWFCLSILRRVDLPECLTSLLNVQPQDVEAA